jgi:predicted nucleic acid-binding protein
MSTVYVDTSALARVLLDEPDRRVIGHSLATFDRRVASRLLGVELRRVGLRRELSSRAETLLADVSLLPIDERTLAAAETLTPPIVGTLDAIHLATALRLAAEGGLDALMTYDKRLAQGAEEHGLAVLAPS